jgi:hypothetical protein
MSRLVQSRKQLAHPPKCTELQSLRTCWAVPSIYIIWDKLPSRPKFLGNLRRIPVTATTLPAFVDSLKTRPGTEGLRNSRTSFSADFEAFVPGLARLKSSRRRMSLLELV